MAQNRRGRPEKYSAEFVKKMAEGAAADGVSLKAYVMMNFKPCVEAPTLKKAGLIYGAIWASGVRNKVITVTPYKQK